MIEEQQRGLKEEEREALETWRTRLNKSSRGRRILFTLTLIAVSVIVLVSLILLWNTEYNGMLYLLVGTVLLYLGLNFWSNRQLYKANATLAEQISFALKQNTARVITVSCQQAFQILHNYRISYLFVDDKEKGFFINYENVVEDERLPNSDFDLIEVFDQEGNILEAFVEKRGVTIAAEALDSNSPWRKKLDEKEEAQKLQKGVILM